jgi:hypothetical protein
MTKTISEKPNTQASTPSAKLDPIMQGRRNRRSKRQPQEVPGPEIYVEIGKSLDKFHMDVLFGTLDGRPDRVVAAFRQLNDLNSQAFDTFLELHREMRHLQARCDELWEVKKSTRAKL